MTAPVTVIGRAGVPGLDTARDLLARNGVAHRWVDLDRDPLRGLVDVDRLSGVRAMAIALVHSYLAMTRGGSGG